MSHRFNPAVQLTTTVMGEAVASSAVTLIRKALAVGRDRVLLLPAGEYGGTPVDPGLEERRRNADFQGLYSGPHPD